MNVLITLRAKKEEAVFSNTRDYLEFLQILIDAKKKYSLAVYAFCVMPDYGKIIAGFSSGHHVREFMRLVNRKYQDYLFIVYAAKDDVFRNEIPVVLQGSFELMDAIKKIESEPVAAGISNAPAQYPYCSAFYRCPTSILENVI